MWFKPAAALAPPNSTVPFPPQAHRNFPDFEGELTVVLRATPNGHKNVSAADAPSAILGYTIGNDLTARVFQRTAGQGQYTYAKGFDAFAPLGPRLVHPRCFDPTTASGITTRVNGKTVQDSPFDFIFQVPQLVEFLTNGVTVPGGTAILTGTPSGVGWFQNPKCELKDGDVVEVEVKEIGTLRNTIKFE
jgi:2-keto-4-pentenoate hydratase/2-oxohepta-3-ene-1,7-dioic acid hydratase in catechol pathway